MQTQSRKLAVAIAISLAMLAASAPVLATGPPQAVIDARQESQIWTTYALSPYLRASDIRVSVLDGKATLTGNVAEAVNRDLAKQIALGVNGIEEVDNQLVVLADYTPPARTERTFGEFVDDATITAAIKSKLMWSKHTDGLDIDVDTTAGKVMLRGTADTEVAKELAARLAMNTRGVESVDNRLMVSGERADIGDGAAQAADEAHRDVADSWITTKVKSTFMYSSNVDGADIAVSTASGVVTLSGKVHSGAERALAIELAQNILGVKSVNSDALTI